MKQFFKYVLATIVGIFIVGVIISILSILSLVGMATMGSTTASVKDNSVLVIQLEGSINERSEENPFAQIIGNKALEQQGLDDILAAIKKAKDEDKVKGIYIEAGTFAGAMPATLQAIRNALVDFKKAGKFIVSYGDTYTQGTYYLCSVADSVVVNPQGMIDWSGLSSQVTYYKDLLEKVGVEMQVVKVGTYKSAVEPFLLNEMSEANREQILTYDTEIWGEMTKAISKSRGISVAKLNELADTLMLLQDAQLYKKEKMVDKLAYSDDVPNMIARMMKVDDPEDYHTMTVSDLAGAASSEPKGTSGNVVAVYYATGDIVQEASTGFNTEPEIVGKTVIKDLQKLAEDEDVKAVVLRVNSGGGSAYASEQIWHQVMNIKSKKPIVVSMSDMAASGGYYISCAANYIFAEPTTITGSIGIFGMFPNAGQLLNDKLGVHFSTVKTNKFSDFGDFSRPFTEQERAKAQTYINNGYELFTKRCADGRGMKQDAIKKIGEGRVWTGLHAKQIGLVDELGGLDQAIEKAKKLANLDEASVMNYPAKSNILDNLLNEMKGNSYADKQLREALGDYYIFFSDMKNVNQKTGIQTALPYYLRFNL
jgi:protease-4